VRLYLVRHAAVTVRPEVPAERWHLSPEGRDGASALAEDPSWPDVALIYTSPEPKAVATAQRIAAPHKLAIAIERDLREVGGRSWTSEDYRAVVRRYLAGEAVAGWEPRAEALDRMHAAIDSIAQRHPDGHVAVVSHGLVLTLWLTDLLGLDAVGTLDLWNRIRFPDLAIVDPGARRLERDFGAR
jgi:broad specificity phosphatase PhoE